MIVEPAKAADWVYHMLTLFSVSANCMLTAEFTTVQKSAPSKQPSLALPLPSRDLYLQAQD